MPWLNPTCCYSEWYVPLSKVMRAAADGRACIEPSAITVCVMPAVPHACTWRGVSHLYPPNGLPVGRSGTRLRCALSCLQLRAC
eukprot:1030333-Pelagomonas_calceolata.AAC.1